MEYRWDQIITPPTHWERIALGRDLEMHEVLRALDCPQCRLPQHGASKRLFSKTDCPCCLTTDCEPPNAFLSCGHVLCVVCLERLGGSLEPPTRPATPQATPQAEQTTPLPPRPQLHGHILRLVENLDISEHGLILRLPASGLRRPVAISEVYRCLKRTAKRFLLFLTWFQVACTTLVGLSWLGLPPWFTLPVSTFVGVHFADVSNANFLTFGLVHLGCFFSIIFMLQLGSACFLDCQALVSGIAEFPNFATMLQVHVSHAAVVKVLMALGADSNKGLTFAARGGHTTMFEAILASGGNARHPPVLSIAAAAGHAEMVRKLLARGADPNPALLRLGLGHPLTAAVAGGHLEAVKALLAGGAEPNPREPLWNAEDHAIAAAAALNHSEIVRLLLLAGADPSPRACLAGPRSHPLAAALSRGHTQVVRMLLAAGAEYRSEETWQALLARAPGAENFLVATLRDWRLLVDSTESGLLQEAAMMQMLLQLESVMQFGDDATLRLEHALRRSSKSWRFGPDDRSLGQASALFWLLIGRKSFR